MLLIAVLLFVAIGAASATEIPDYIQICKRNDPDLDGCMSRSIVHIQPYLAEGIPELKVPSLEPFVLEELAPINGKGLKVSAKNLKVYGGSKVQISNLKVNIDTLITDFDALYPELYFTGDYEVKGKLLVLPLDGSGTVTGNVTNIHGHAQMQFEVKKNEDGMEYLYCTKFQVKSVANKGVLHLDNLLGGDPVLGDTINNAINSNFATFSKEFGPMLDVSLSKVLKDVANNVFKAFTYEQLFPTK